MLRAMPKLLDYWRPVSAIIGAILMGSGLIGLPSLSDDLARWPPILGQLVAGLDLVTQTQLGRWVLFGVGVTVFYVAVTARNRQPTVAPPPVTSKVLKPPVASTGHVPAAIRPPDDLPALGSSRVFIGTEPRFLVGLLEGHTDLQGQKLVASYIGNWIHVMGRVSDVTEITTLPREPGIPYVQMHVGAEETLVSLLFDPDWSDRLAVVRKNDSLDAIGKIRAVSAAAVSLESCEVVYHPENA